MLRVSLLGEQTIVDASGRPRACSSRAIALVAFLALHAGAPQTRQHIAMLFWPDSTDAQALTNLRRELHHLRQALDDDGSLVVTSRDLCWGSTETCRVDLRRFAVEREAALAAAGRDDTDGLLASASAALDHYGGDLLPGLYDDWLLDARSRIERQCVELCDLLSSTRSRTGDPAGAVEAARRRVVLQPLEEVGYRTLMRLQADLGDRAGAVSTYHHCASVLERELGVVPDPATRQALRAVMIGATRPDAGGPADAPPDAMAGGGVQPGEPAADRSGFAGSKLVGRAGELDRLRAAWEGAVAGRPGLVLVRGGAGVGKSRLVDEIAATAVRDRGAVVATSRCFGGSGRLALAPVADWMRHPSIAAASTTLDPAWRAEVARLVPSGAGRAAGTGAGSRAMADAWQRHRFFEGLARALLAVDGPTLFVLENMQWCDQETLAFLAFFLGLARDAPVLVAGTVRNDSLDEDRDLGDWTVRMRATGLLTELSLSPLDVAETARLAEAIRGRPVSDADGALLQATTGGFPLYVVEAVRSSVDLGRPSIPVGDLTAVLRSRLEQASAPAREVAGLAAAVRTDFTLELLAEASDLDATAVVEAVDELWRRRIVRELPGGYDFSHDLLRETAYDQVSPPRRWLLHRRVAQALELTHADDKELVSARLAEQYERGGRPRQAIEHYLRAADVAAARFAHGDATRLYTDALSLVRAMPEGRDRDRRELAVLESMAAPLNARYGYSSPRLRATLERSVVLSESLGRKDSMITGLVALWTSRIVQGHLTDAYRTATRALDLVGEDSEASGPAHFAFGGSALSLGMPEQGLRHLDLAAELSTGALLSVGTRPDVHGMAWSAHALWLLGRDDDALARSQEAVTLARGSEHPYNLAVALAYGAITLQMRGALAELRDTVGELRELCDRYGFAYYREWGLILDGWSRDGPSGVDLARRGVAALKDEGSFARMPYWLSMLADVSARHGDRDGARATLDAALVAARMRDDVWWLPEVMRMRAAYDGPEAAVARLRDAAAMASAQGSAGLLRRCQGDLLARGGGVASAGVRAAAPGVAPAG